jgi:hypothetical protein
MNFFFQCLKDNAQPDNPYRILSKKYHLFGSLSILISRIEHPPSSLLAGLRWTGGAWSIA